MRMRPGIFATFTFLITIVSIHAELQAQADDGELATRAGAPLFEGMGKHHHPISTDNANVQRYFDQGLVLSFAFNHAESAHSGSRVWAARKERADSAWLKANDRTRPWSK